VVLLDEPYGALDPPGFDLVDGVIRELKRRGTTILMATHQVERSRTYADMEIVLEEGRVVRTAAQPAGGTPAFHGVSSC